MRMTPHAEKVLLENGYTWEDIAQLKEQGIIASERKENGFSA